MYRAEVRFKLEEPFIFQTDSPQDFIEEIFTSHILWQSKDLKKGFYIAPSEISCIIFTEIKNELSPYYCLEKDEIESQKQKEYEKTLKEALTHQQHHIEG